MKNVKEMTDREVLERIAVNAKRTADNTDFLKTVVVTTLIISIISMVISWFY